MRRKPQPINNIKRDVRIEKNSIDAFMKNAGRKPETKEDWTSILKIAYPKQLPENFIKYLTQ